MPLRNHLHPDEDILARVSPFYATSRRILRFDSLRNGEERFTELPYARVKSIEIVRPPNHRLMAGGTVVSIGGLFLAMFVGLYTPMIAVPAGLAMIMLGGNGTGMGRYFQLTVEEAPGPRAAGANVTGEGPNQKEKSASGKGARRKEQALWQVPYVGSMDFIGAVGQRTGKTPKE